MFRKGIEGSFVLDVVRTILHTAVAAAAQAHDVCVSVLRTSEDAIESHPELHAARIGGELQRASDCLAREMIVRRLFTDAKDGQC